jgi:hypothetical protein
MLTRRATSAASSRASMPTMRTTRSAGISITSPESVSLTSISMSQPSLGGAGRMTGRSFLSYIKNMVFTSDPLR